MSKQHWTDQQLDAITTKYTSSGESCNLLVSAAAGSGKTAVLVERIIQKLLPQNGKPATDADRLLVVTFTNAAAREMAERINIALDRELQKAIESGDKEQKKKIKRQQLLLSVSDITTIDAFCLKLLRKYFNVIGLEPDFSIADESQAQILSEEAMEELFSELYDSGDEEFLDLLCLYGTSRSDDALASLVRHIYKFTRSIPFPEKWLAEKVNELSCPSGISKTRWFQEGISQVSSQLSSALAIAEKALMTICEVPDIASFVRNNPPEKGVPVFDEWKSYYKAFYYDYISLQEIVKTDCSNIFKLLANFEHTSLSALASKSDEEKDFLKNLRQNIKTNVASAKAFLSATPEEMEAQSRDKLYPIAVSILHLVEKYDKLFSAKKLDKNLLEFHDAEQLSAKLLSENPDISEEVRNRYDEVLMDEYQDTSLLQDEIFKYVTNGNNLFMVGDMKQSIYRFRSSDPTIFKDKSDSYCMEIDSLNRKIVLSNNFRSRPDVLDSVNDIFEAIMTESAGELDYDEHQKLYNGRPFDVVNPSYISECHIIEGPDSDSDDDDVTNPQLEARLVAEQINKLKTEHFKVLDGDNSRDIENRDIVILMSSYKSSAEHYIAELQSAGIECFVESSGYFERNEIRTIISLLKIISNPYCDIPLLAVMRSPIASFTDDELVIIRKFKKGRFFGAIKEIITQYNDGVISSEEEIAVAKKVEHFYTRLNCWREYSHFMPTDKLLWRLYEETDFYAFCGALYDGDEAQANLRLLFDRAKQYESGGFEGLFNFIKYLELIEKKDTDLSSAKQSGEAHNVVRIMTIHKSKGLEFPVVFITGGGKRFNKSSDESRVLLHKDLGIAMDYIDFENNYRTETPAKAVFKAVSNREQVSEEIRKLYVATTRAKEKLFFVATVSGHTDKTGKSKFSEKLDKWNSYRTENGVVIPPEDVLSASGFADWVAPVALSSDNWEFFERKYSEIGFAKQSASEEVSEETHKPENVLKILDFEYPFRDITDLPTKVSVSELKGKGITHLTPLPKFLQETEPDGAFYGTAIHKVLENVKVSDSMDSAYIVSNLKDFVESGIMSEKEALLINADKISAFYESALGKRIRASSKVLREQAFEVEIPVNMVYPDAKNAENEKIILQGVIDCYFKESDGIVLVDYKTDRYSNISEIHEKYDRQLELYAYALSKITKLPVKEKYIYLFSTGDILQC